MKTKSDYFKLTPIDAFDARPGYSRWILPGVGVRTTERGSLAEADLWVDPKGRLVTRFKSLGYTLHFEIRIVSEKQITHEMQDDIAEFLSEMLLIWQVDSVDNDLDCDDVIYDETGI